MPRGPSRLVEGPREPQQAQHAQPQGSSPGGRQAAPQAIRDQAARAGRVAGVSLARDLRESGESLASAGSAAQGQSPGKAGGHTGSPGRVRVLEAEDSSPAPSRRAGPAGATPAYPGCRITSSYKAFCRLDRRHFSTCSYFFVSCFSTSLFVLLKIKGCVTCEGDECALPPCRAPIATPGAGPGAAAGAHVPGAAV